MFFRSADRLLRTADDVTERAQVVRTAARLAPRASGRVLLSLREHLISRMAPTGVSRVYANRGARGMAAADTRKPRAGSKSRPARRCQAISGASFSLR